MQCDQLTQTPSTPTYILAVTEVSQNKPFPPAVALVKCYVMAVSRGAGILCFRASPAKAWCSGWGLLLFCPCLSAVFSNYGYPLTMDCARFQSPESYKMPVSSVSWPFLSSGQWHCLALGCSVGLLATGLVRVGVCDTSMSGVGIQPQACGLMDKSCLPGPFSASEGKVFLQVFSSFTFACFVV